MDSDDVPNQKACPKTIEEEQVGESEYPGNASDPGRKTAFVIEREKAVKLSGPDGIAEGDGTSTTNVPTARGNIDVSTHGGITEKAKGNGKHRKRSRPLTKSASKRNSVHLSENAADDDQLKEEASHMSEAGVEIDRVSSLSRQKPERSRSEHTGPGVNNGLGIKPYPTAAHVPEASQRSEVPLDLTSCSSHQDDRFIPRECPEHRTATSMRRGHYVPSPSPPAPSSPPPSGAPPGPPPPRGPPPPHGLPISYDRSPEFKGDDENSCMDGFDLRGTSSERRAQSRPISEASRDIHDHNAVGDRHSRSSKSSSSRPPSPQPPPHRSLSKSCRQRSPCGIDKSHDFRDDSKIQRGPVTRCVVVEGMFYVFLTTSSAATAASGVALCRVECNATHMDDSDLFKALKAEYYSRVEAFSRRNLFMKIK